MIHKTITGTTKAIDESTGIVEAFTNTMGVVDADGDIVEPTAFNISIADNLPIPVLSGHDQGKLVGKVIFAQPRLIEGDEYRLFTRMQMNMDTEAGRDAYSNVAGDYVREWSVGFNIPRESDVSQEGGDVSTIVRRIANLDWVEVSSVIRGSSPSTETVAAKASPVVEDEKVSFEPAIGEVDPDVTDEAASDTAPEAALDTAERTLRLQRVKLALHGIHNQNKEY